MQFISVSAITVALVSMVAAKSCVNGGVYCGESLLNRGNYHDHIVQVLEANGQPADNLHVENSLFRCTGGGNIVYQQFCNNGCGGVGSHEADYCL